MSLIVWSVSYQSGLCILEKTVLAHSVSEAYEAFVAEIPGLEVTKIEQVVKVDINACQ